jgi:hypothetical protein
MARMADGGGDEQVLLSARVSDFDVHTTWGAQAAQRRLVQRGDVVVWQDGGQEQVWRLPDQPADDAVPTLASVVYAATEAVLPNGGGVPETHVLLVGDDGRALATVAVATVAYGGMSDVELENLWPRAQFEGLRARGVAIEQTETADLRALNEHLPGAVPHGRALLYSRRAFALFLGLLAVAIVVALIATRG